MTAACQRFSLSHSRWPARRPAAMPCSKIRSASSRSPSIRRIPPSVQSVKARTAWSPPFLGQLQRALAGRLRLLAPPAAVVEVGAVGLDAAHHASRQRAIVVIGGRVLAVGDRASLLPRLCIARWPAPLSRLFYRFYALLFQGLGGRVQQRERLVVGAAQPEVAQPAVQRPLDERPAAGRHRPMPGRHRIVQIVRQASGRLARSRAEEALAFARDQVQVVLGMPVRHRREQRRLLRQALGGELAEERVHPEAAVRAHAQHGLADQAAQQLGFHFGHGPCRFGREAAAEAAQAGDGEPLGRR